MSESWPTGLHRGITLVNAARFARRSADHQRRRLAVATLVAAMLLPATGGLALAQTAAPPAPGQEIIATTPPEVTSAPPAGAPQPVIPAGLPSTGDGSGQSGNLALPLVAAGALAGTLAFRRRLGARARS